MDKLLKRIWMSKGGAVIMFFVYVGVIVIASLFKLTYFSMNRILGYLLVPGAILITPSANGGPWLGVDSIVIVLSLLIYMFIGYIVDWFYKPYK